MNAFEIIFTVVLYVLSIIYVYRRGYANGGKMVLNEWKQFMNETEEDIDEK